MKFRFQAKTQNEKVEEKFSWKTSMPEKWVFFIEIKCVYEKLSRFLAIWGICYVISKISIEKSWFLKVLEAKEETFAVLLWGYFDSFERVFHFNALAYTGFTTLLPDNSKDITHFSCLVFNCNEIRFFSRPLLIWSAHAWVHRLCWKC